MKLAILVSESSWFLPYGKQLQARLRIAGHIVDLFFSGEMIHDTYQICFILSYFELLDDVVLKRSVHNLVVHESALPHGKGMAPLFWQILEGKNDIPIVLFEATAKADAGNIYFSDIIKLNGTELHDEIRLKQAKKTIELCEQFISLYPNVSARAQIGEESYYSRRTPADSELDVEKTIAEQFDRLRIACNEKYPAFFTYRGEHYILKIEKFDG